MSLNEAPAAERIGRHARVAPRDDDALRTYVVTHVNEAIANGWIRPYYQPVVRTLTGKLCGYEALARWEDPEYGMLSPAVFIPALEQARAIHLLDCCIVRQVCKHYRERSNGGVEVVPVSFNLSRLDFDLCDIFNVIESAAHEYQVPRHMLNIEITESVLGVDPEYMSSMMSKFHNAGYQVWMDDFGSGYSALNVLKDFDFDELKIDMVFLSRFGDKSKTILASVVDMAKKLGIQTLAEGVETEEHRDYLRHIGCEKMQGYLFGKPKPFDLEAAKEHNDSKSIEKTPERLYQNEIGAVNTLSISEYDLTTGGSSQGYVTNMPLAIVEFQDDRFMMVDSNLAFKDGLANIGVASVEEAQRLVNDTHRQIARKLRRIMATIEDDKFARLDLMLGDNGCVLRARHITTRDGKTALLVSIGDTVEQSEQRRHDRMDDMLAVMYAIYEHVDIIHLDEGYIEPVFSNTGLRAHMEAPSFESVTANFANTEVYELDRERYTKFMDHDTMVERIKTGGEIFISDFFRLRQQGGDYVWKLFVLIYLADQPGNSVMLCIRNTHWKHDGLFQAAYDEHRDELPRDMQTADLSLNDGSLWRAIVRNEHMKLFWKDDQRRFTGANQAFLDYFGFDSLDDILGKTDENMGWHIDPTPFAEDDRRVLEEGALIEDMTGQHIIKGEMRDVIMTKYPVYRNGQIVGLLGYLIDVDEVNTDSEFNDLPVRDEVTGTLNYTGLEAATWRYVDAYKRQGIDFAMVSINIESFQAINKALGYAFGEKVLGYVGKTLAEIAGNKRVVGHVHSERFVILARDDTDEELQSLCDEIETRLISITEVDGVNCTVYALAGFARFSKLGDVEAMKRYNRDRRLERRDEKSETSNEDDIITSSLL